MRADGNIDDINGFFAYDDGVYSDEEQYYESDYPDEKEGERSSDTIVVDELEGIDFSSLSGDFKSSLKKLTKRHAKNSTKISKIIAPSNRPVIVEGLKQEREVDPLLYTPELPRKIKQAPKRTSKKKIINSLKLDKDWGVNKEATIYSDGIKSMAKVIVPRDRNVIIEGMNKFILDKNCGATDIKSIGYCNNKKLKEMVFIINNEGNVDFTAEFFNPSTVLDYLQATGLNINDKISVAGQGVDGVQYSDVMWHMQSNPTRIYNCRITISGTTEEIMLNQRNVNLGMLQKDLRAYTDFTSINTQLFVDKFQFQSNIVAFNFDKELGRPYVPDGMDILRYTVLAGCTVSIAFYYEQKYLKKYFFKELRDNKRVF